MPLFNISLSSCHPPYSIIRYPLSAYRRKDMRSDCQASDVRWAVCPNAKGFRRFRPPLGSALGGPGSAHRAGWFRGEFYMPPAATGKPYNRPAGVGNAFPLWWLAPPPFPRKRWHNNPCLLQSRLRRGASRCFILPPEQGWQGNTSHTSEHILKERSDAQNIVSR